MISRRHWLGASGLALAAACRKPKGTGFPGYALVATAGANSLAAVDLNTFRLTTAVPLPAAPTEIVSEASHSFVLTPANQSIHVLDDALRLIASKRLANQVHSLRLIPDQLALVLVAGQELIRLESPSLRLTGRYKLSVNPVDVDVSGSFVALSGGAHATVELFNTATGDKRKRDLGTKIGSVRFRKDGKILLVANLGERCLSILDVPSLERVVDLPLAILPEYLCFSADQGQLFVAGKGMDAVAIVFPYQMQVEQTVLAGRTPGVMACSETPPYLFVASRDGSDVSILDLQSRRLVGAVEVGQMPVFITTTPDSQYALILNQVSGDMAVIRIPPIRFNRERSGVSLFTMIPVGEKPMAASIVSAA